PGESTDGLPGPRATVERAADLRRWAQPGVSRWVGGVAWCPGLVDLVDCHGVVFPHRVRLRAPAPTGDWPNARLSTDGLAQTVSTGRPVGALGVGCADCGCVAGRPHRPDCVHYDLAIGQSS